MPQDPLDLALDPATGDLDLSSGGATLLDWDAAGYAQRVGIRLRLQLAEWVLDTSAGVPWREAILLKGVTADLAGQIIRREILRVPGILRLEQFQANLDPVTRLLSFSFRAVAGTPATGLDEPEAQVIQGQGGINSNGQAELLCLVEGVGGFFS